MVGVAAAAGGGVSCVPAAVGEVTLVRIGLSDEAEAEAWRVAVAEKRVLLRRCGRASAARTMTAAGWWCRRITGGKACIRRGGASQWWPTVRGNPRGYRWGYFPLLLTFSLKDLCLFWILF